jgi:fatty-acyl-CoA synthase
MSNANIEELPLHVGTWARLTPDKPAMTLAGSGQTLTYADLDERAARTTNLLRSSGCAPGDHYALLMETNLVFPQLTWAGQRSGLYYTPINVRLAPVEAAYIVDNCAAKVVVASYAQRETAAALRARCTGVTRWFMVDGVIDGFEPFEPAVAAQPTTPVDDAIEGAPMLYSSGTTGRPKGVKRPLSGNPAGTTLFGLGRHMAASYGLSSDSVSLVPTPLYHSTGLTRMMLTQSLGGTLVAMQKFDAEQALATIEKYKVTHAVWVGTMFIRLLRLPDDVRAKYDISSMVDAAVGSGPCSIEVKKKMIDWWGPIITENYGGTEGNGQTRITSEEWLAHPGSVGRAIFGEPHIVREDGTEAGPGEVGVIYFSGGRPFEYHLDPDKTKSVYNDRGWSTLGDVGYLDEDGFLYITDRIAEMIISGGVNIYPREIEEVLIEHPAVDDVAVIGVPNDEFGEEVKAVVIVRNGYQAGDDLEAELIAFCRQSLAGYKIPRSVDFVTELPRNDTGKMYKRLLRDQYWAGRESKLV